MQKWFRGEKYLEKCVWNVKFQEPKSVKFLASWHIDKHPMILALPQWKQPVDTGFARFFVAPGRKKGLDE